MIMSIFTKYSFVVKYYLREVIFMHNQSYSQERTDRLAMLYMNKHYDISSMSIDEFVKTFEDICNEITTSMQMSNH